MLLSVTGERALDGDRTIDSSDDVGEDDEETVPRVVDLCAGVAPEQ